VQSIDFFIPVISVNGKIDLTFGDNTQANNFYIFLCSLPSGSFSIIYNSTLYFANHGAFCVDFVSMAFWLDFYRISIYGSVATSEPRGLME